MMAQNDQYRISNCSVVECNGFYVASGALRYINKTSKYVLEHVPGICWKIAIGNNNQYETDGDSPHPTLCNWFDSVTKKMEVIVFAYYVEGPRLAALVDWTGSPFAAAVAPNSNPVPALELHHSAKNFSEFNKPAGRAESLSTPIASRTKTAAALDPYSGQDPSDTEGKEDSSSGEEWSPAVRPGGTRRGAQPYPTTPVDSRSEQASVSPVDYTPRSEPSLIYCQPVMCRRPYEEELPSPLTAFATYCAAHYEDAEPLQKGVEDAFEKKNDLFKEVSQIQVTTPSADTDSDRNVDNMMVQTMYKMVEDIEIVVDGCTFQKKVLFLTNHQCNLFKPEGFLRCLKALDVGKPKCVIRLLAADHGVAYFEVHDEQKGQIFAPHRYASDLDAHDAGESRTRLDQFMETCILPLAKRTHALIICSGCNDSELTASLERVVVPEQARLGENCPFKVLTFVWTFEVHYNASRGEGVARKVAGRCKAWRERFDAVSKYMTTLSTRDVQRCDLTNAASHVVVFDSVEGGISERGPSLAFQAKLTDALTMQVPSFAIQVLQCDYKDAADLSRRGIPILFLDSRERSINPARRQIGTRATNLAKKVLHAEFGQTLPQQTPGRRGVHTQFESFLTSREESSESAAGFAGTSSEATATGRAGSWKEVSGKHTENDTGASSGKTSQSVSNTAIARAATAPGVNARALTTSDALNDANVAKVLSPSERGADGMTCSLNNLPAAPTGGGRSETLSEVSDGQVLLQRAFDLIKSQLGILAKSGIVDYDNSSAVALIHSALKFGVDRTDYDGSHVPLYARIQELKRAEQDSGSTSARSTVPAGMLRHAAQFFVLKMRMYIARQKLEKVTRFLAKGGGGDKEEEATKWKKHLEEMIAAAEGDGGYSEAGDAENMLHIQQLLSSPITFSGCLFDLDDLCRTVLSIVKIDRLPKENSLEALLSLRDAWDHVDAYHQYADFYKVMTKMSYALLILAGLATCVIAVRQVGGVGGSGARQYVILTISLVSTAVAAYVNFMNPAQLWQQLRGAAISMESEIWMFRTRAGDYRSNNASDADSSHADNLLQERILAIKKEVLESGYIKRTAFLGRLYHLNLRQQHGSKLPPSGHTSTWLSAMWSCLQFLTFGFFAAAGNAYGTSSVSSGGASSAESPEDDHYQPVPSSSYVEFRIKTVLRFYKKRIPTCNRTRATSPSSSPLPDRWPAWSWLS